MDQREILDFGPGHYEVWDYWGNRVFEGQSWQECEDWLDDNPEETDDG